MNRYPLWKYILIALVLCFGMVYTLPNFFGEAPAVQVSSGKTSVKVEPALADVLVVELKNKGIAVDAVFFEPTLGGGSLKLRFSSTDDQLKARDVVQAALNPNPLQADYVVALNLVSRSPEWLSKLGALPMYLGLDLRGGVHFLLQVDMAAALEKRKDALFVDAKQTLRDMDVRYMNASRNAAGFSLAFRSAEDLDKARLALSKRQSELSWVAPTQAQGFVLQASLASAVEQQVRDYALRQNITTLHNRINELGVAEPIIQRQGADRIVVQLPGVQDTAKAKSILGRTATLEVRMVDDSPAAVAAQASGIVPLGLMSYPERGGGVLLLRSDVLLTGDNLTDAQAGFDQQTRESAVHLTLDAAGTRIFRNITRDNIGKRMAIVLIEKGRGEVVTAPGIRDEIGGGRVQISGQMNTAEAADLALLLRAGALAAPMDIVEERTIGPSLGAANISKGINSTLYGFVALSIFMVVYYTVFGFFSVFALAVNVLLLFALLSVLQATLTLPGLAAVALTLGMAIDANVLINERIREELRAGASPQQAIHIGYDKAWATILDSNITTLIAGLALLIFGSGPVRGFAVVHCLGILTSIFSAVVVSRALVNLWYGGRKKLSKVSIGEVWRGQNAASTSKAQTELGALPQHKQ